MTGPSRIGWIGAGQMASAMARALVDGGVVAANDIIAADPNPQARQRFGEAIPDALVTDDNAAAAANPVVILAVKPQLVEVVGKSVGPLPPSTLLVSIAAGKTIAQLSASFQTDRIVRVMPNTPCLVGMSACGFAAAENVAAEDRRIVARLLAATGLAIEVSEKQLDAVTGLSGSGPAFIYLLIEAMSDAGVRMGLPRDAATKLAAQTVKGAGEMVLRTKLHPGVLKDQVTSPAGTTIAGIHRLEQSGFRGAVMDAVVAAAERAAQLGEA